MDRSEAYQILESHLRELVISLPESLPVDLTIRGRSGALYQMNFELEDGKLHGTICDSNTQKFVLLEESIDIEDANPN